MFCTTSPHTGPSSPWTLTLTFILLAAVGFSRFALAVQPDQRGELLDEKEYRSEIEEVVVTARKPDWRQQSKPEWRSQRFELPEQKSTSRMEWVPEYTKDERDLYDGVRDRKGEKPEFKLFEFRF